MSDPNTLGDLVSRFRAGDPAAAEELVRHYEPRLRREVHARLDDRRLRHLLDSTDICQSVLAGFVQRAATGRYDGYAPGSLMGLLVVMGRRKLTARARQLWARGRDPRREVTLDAAAFQAVAADPSPSRQVAGRDLLDAFRRRLRPEELALADLRAEGLGWDQIAARVGGTAEARRKQLARASARVEDELGLRGGSDGH